MRQAWWVAVCVLVSAAPVSAKDAPSTKEASSRKESASTKEASSRKDAPSTKDPASRKEAASTKDPASRKEAATSAKEEGATSGPAAPKPAAWRPEWTALWTEALTRPADKTLGANENGYRLKVRVGRTGRVPEAVTAITTYWFSEIDFTGDEPAWTREKQLRKGLPAAVALSERGVFFLEKPLEGAALARHVKTGTPTVGTGGRGRVEVHALGAGEVTCFVPGGGDGRNAPSAELCLAPGRGIVAVRGAFVPEPGLLFLDPAFVEER